MQWEYYWLTNSGNDEVIGATLGKLGAEGWELVSVVLDGGGYMMFYLKRQKSN